MVDLEPIYAALFAKLGTVNSQLSDNLKITTVGQWLKHWDDVPPASQPALFLKMGPPDVHQKARALPIWTLRASVWIYFKAEGSNDQDYFPIKVVRSYIKAVGLSLDPVTPGEKQTLGGVVQHCWLEGQIHFDEGIPGIDKQAVLVIPIMMETAI